MTHDADFYQGQPGNLSIAHYKLATFSQRQKPMCLLGDIVQYRLLGDKGCNFIMSLSSGDPQPIISNVALGQHWKLLALAHHLIKPQALNVGNYWLQLTT